MAIPDDLPPEAVADCFGPPPEPCECYCLHCQRVVNSSDMWYQRVIDGPPGLGGFWMCPTPNCDGQGFSFDLHPTDPDHPANAGWSWSDDEEWDESDDVDGGDESADYDPAEPQYADDGPDEEVVEGDEWKPRAAGGRPGGGVARRGGRPSASGGRAAAVRRARPAAADGRRVGLAAGRRTAVGRDRGRRHPVLTPPGSAGRFSPSRRCPRAWQSPASPARATASNRSRVKAAQ